MSVKEIKKELARRHEPSRSGRKRNRGELLAAQPKYEMPVSAAGMSIHQDTRIRHVSAGIDHTLAVTFRARCTAGAATATINSASAGGLTLTPTRTTANGGHS